MPFVVKIEKTLKNPKDSQEAKTEPGIKYYHVD